MTEDTKKKIDIILEETVRIYANLGTKTPLDLGTKQAAKERERELIDLIKDIDEDFYHDNLMIPRAKTQENSQQES